MTIPQSPFLFHADLLRWYRTGNYYQHNKKYFCFRTFGLVVLLSQYLRDVSIPIPFIRTTTGAFKRYEVFKIFPVSVVHRAGHTLNLYCWQCPGKYAYVLMALLFCLFAFVSLVMTIYFEIAETLRVLAKSCRNIGRLREPNGPATGLAKKKCITAITFKKPPNN